MMYLYDSKEIEFSRNGETLENAFDAKIVHYLNGEFTLTFSLNMQDEATKLIEVNKIVMAEGQPFRITNIKPSTKSFEIYARHVFYDLLDFQVESVNVNQVQGLTVMNAIFANNDTNFTYRSDIMKRSTMNDKKKNIVEMLNRATSLFEGELVRNKFSVAMNEKVGKDTGIVIYPTKNVSTAIRETDVSNVCTRVIVEYDVEIPNEVVGEVAEKETKQVVIVSGNVDLYPHAKTRRYTNNDLTNDEDAIKWGTGKFGGVNRIDVPKVSIEINLEIDRDLRDVEIGDTVVCKIPHLHLDERIQIIGYEFDPVANKRTKIFAGYKAKGISGTINDSVVEQMKPIIDDVDEQLQAEIDKSNAAIDKEYADRVQDVQDAIDKAEADAEAMKEQIRGEIAQEWKEWDEEWELA
ncbi:MAG: phage tail spike protein, partial [Culicoidibacterales bacterium]